MDEPLDELYLKWLYSQVASVRFTNPARTYWSLMKHLYTKEFFWYVPNDDNRAEDGRDLRLEFIQDTHADPDSAWLKLGCSVLEMLIGLSRRLSFEAEGEPRAWFWELLENLDLDDYSDLYYTNAFTKELVDDIVDTMIWRTYEFDGTGGLFPLKNAYEDQTEVELWYQLSFYLRERE